MEPVSFPGEVAEKRNMLIGDWFRFVSSTAKIHKGEAFLRVPDRDLTALLAPYNAFHLRQMLLAELFLFEVRDGKKVRTFAPCDRVSSFLAVPGFLAFARSMLGADDFALLDALARVAYRSDDTDVIAKIVPLLGEADLLKLCLRLIRQRGTESFRVDGVDTLLVAKWAQLRCAEFLEFLAPLLNGVLALPDGFELDPDRIRHPSLASGNARNIETVVDSIVAAFTNTPLDKVPLFLVHLLRSLDGVAIGELASLFVLRILTPAILNPERYRLLDYSLLPTQKRGLLLVAKALQQVANGVPFDRSHWMFSLNGIVESHHKHIVDFLCAIRERTASAPALDAAPSNADAAAEALRTLLVRLPRHADAMAMMLDFSPEALFFGASSMLAVRFRFVYRFSLKREPNLLADSGSGSSSHASEDDGPAAVRAGAAPQVPESLAEANRLFTPAQNAAVDVVNAVLEKKRVLFCREFICTALRGADFSTKRAVKILSAYHEYYAKQLRVQRIIISDVEEMVMAGVLLVHPQLVTVSGKPVMFMRPARYVPKTTPTSSVIRLLAYMTQRLTESVTAQVLGFTFVADLGNWTMANFSRQYAMTWFLAMLVMPVRLESFIIIDAPSWFGSIWSIIKMAMTKSFQKKWAYVTRDTIDTVMARAHRPPDIADGTLDINLAQYCEERRVAEDGPEPPVFRQLGESLGSAKSRGSLIRTSSAAPLSPSLSRSPRVAAPKAATSAPSSGLSSVEDDDDDDTELLDKFAAMTQVGLDQAELMEQRDSSSLDMESEDLFQKARDAAVTLRAECKSPVCTEKLDIIVRALAQPPRKRSVK